MQQPSEVATDRPARAAKRRNQPRTVATGRPSAVAIGRCPAPPASASNAAPITATASARRTSHSWASSTCVLPHAEHRARRGRCRTVPCTPRDDRQRALPHGASTPCTRDRTAPRTATSARPQPGRYLPSTWVPLSTATALLLAKAWEGRRASTERGHAPDANPRGTPLLPAADHIVVPDGATPPTRGQQGCRSTPGRGTRMSASTSASIAPSLLPAGDHQRQRTTMAIDRGMDLGGQPTTRATDPVTCRFSLTAQRAGKEPGRQIRVVRSSPLCPARGGSCSCRAGGHG